MPSLTQPETISRSDAIAAILVTGAALAIGRAIHLPNAPWEKKHEDSLHHPLPDRSAPERRIQEAR